MRWFQGSIPDAINAAKQRSCIFVVVVTGEDEQSTQLLTNWEEEKVSKAATNCVAIKVDAKSETCLLFSHIYPVVCIPSSFFIGANGTPLEVIAGSVSAEELVKRIDRVSQMHLHYIEEGKVPPESNGPVEPVSAEHTASSPAPATGQTASGKDREDELKSASVSSAETTSSDQPRPSAEDNADQVKRLTKRLEERQEQKRMEEEEKEISNEIKRRKVGKDMQDFQRKQDDDKAKRLVEERNRERLMERAARERVKQQIALDRAERAARYANTKQEEKASSPASQQGAQKKTASPSTSATARIQFRLPNGSSLSSSFPSQTRLQEARHFVLQEVGSRYGNFSLATMFPRREFTREDLDRTLLELELVPSASVVLLPQSESSGYAVRSPAGGVWTMLGSLFFPLLAVWRFLSSFLFSAPLQPREGAVRSPAPEASSHTNSTRREPLSQQSVERKPKDYKRDGRICRLRTQDDGEEDNNTWNGNSTQQM